VISIGKEREEYWPNIGYCQEFQLTETSDINEALAEFYFEN